MTGQGRIAFPPTAPAIDNGIRLLLVSRLWSSDVESASNTEVTGKEDEIEEEETEVDEGDASKYEWLASDPKMPVKFSKEKEIPYQI
jgi:hypothetical protein